MLDLLQTHELGILDACQKALAEATQGLGFRVLNRSYSEVPAISLDYAIAEKANNMVCIPFFYLAPPHDTSADVRDFMSTCPKNGLRFAVVALFLYPDFARIRPGSLLPSGQVSVFAEIPVLALLSTGY